MVDSSTTERLFQRYNTFTRRPTVEDATMRRVIFKAFRRTLGPWLPANREAAILDVGCGEGSFLAFLREEGYTNLSGLDLSPENVEICHRLGLTFVCQGNALKVRQLYPGDSFDAVFALDLLEHLPKAAAAGFLEDLRSLLRPGGFLVIQTPNMGSLMGLYHRYNDLSHEFGLTEKSAKDLFMVAGFGENDIEIRPSWNATTFFGYLREVYLRGVHVLVFLAEGGIRPRIPTKNLLIRGHRR